MAKSPNECPGGCGRTVKTAGLACGKECADIAAGRAPKPVRSKVSVASSPASSKRSLLVECEGKIERYFATWIEAAEALETIKANHLYRDAGHETFAIYCDQRWGKTRQWAYEQLEGLSGYRLLLGKGLVSKSEMSNNLTFTASPILAAQAREVAKITRELGPEAAAEAVVKAGPKPTARSLREAAQPTLEVQTVIEGPCLHPRGKCPDCKRPLNAYR